MSGQRPEWWTSGMPEVTARICEAAQRAAESASADDMNKDPRPLVARLLATPVEERGAA